MRKLISLFTGAGGLDLGFEAAGFSTTVAVEMNGDAVATLRANRRWPVLDRDIHEVSSEEVLEASGVSVGDADALIGGPPCQPFSKAGYWSSGDTRRLDDPRAGTLAAYFRVLRDTLPRAFLLENVPGIAFRSKSEGVDFISKLIRGINEEHGTHYTLAVAKLNAAQYGIPQSRERVFVVGARDGAKFEFPQPTHGGEDDLDLFTEKTLLPFSTAWDALSGLGDQNTADLAVRGKWADLLPSIPEGENYLWHTDRGGGYPLFGWRRRYWSFLLKLAKNRPSWTIQAQPGPAIGPFHWTSRRLSTRELCRLQTFPDGYEVQGDLAAVQRQLGNAVPSAMAEVLGKEMRRQFFGDQPRRKIKLIPEKQGVPPEPEPLSEVPRKYWDLIGDHEAHPGTGEGYAARRRGENKARTTSQANSS